MWLTRQGQGEQGGWVRAQGWERACEAVLQPDRATADPGPWAGSTAPSLGARALPAPAPKGLSASPRPASRAWAHQSLSGPWWPGLSRNRVTLLGGGAAVMNLGGSGREGGGALCVGNTRCCERRCGRMASPRKMDTGLEKPVPPGGPRALPCPRCPRPSSRADQPPALQLRGAASHPQWTDAAGHPPAAGTERLPGGKPAASGPMVPSGDGLGARLHPQHAPLPQALMKPGPWAVGARAPSSLPPALPERRAGWRARTVPRQGASCLPAGPGSRLPFIPPEPPQVSENHTGSGIREFNTFHLNPTLSHDPQDVSTLPPGCAPSTRRQDSLWERWPPLPARPWAWAPSAAWSALVV